MTNSNSIKKLLSCLILSVFIAVTVLSFSGCADEKTPDKPIETSAVVSEDVQKVGKGAKSFTLNVEADGKTTTFYVHTDNATVGGALLDLGLISGENSEYGLYVKTVNGIEADYDKDGTYWAFYINDTYALVGVDSAQISDTETYSLRKEK